MDPGGGSTLQAGRTLGHYRLLERIGAGGMGEVWRARDERLEREVALKVLLPGMLADEGARTRFHREALALSRLNHPNVATVFDYGHEAGHDYMVMEYVGGATPGARPGGAALPEAEVLRLGLQLSEGLAAAHAAGIVHRDLKPANVRLTGDGRLKILDFGLAHAARSVGEDAGSEAPTRSASLTAAGALLGTLAYMAPEQVRGERVDARADVWAAGLVLYELATGRRAFAHVDTAPLLHAILNEPVAPPRKLNPGISASLEAIVLTCLEKNAAKRYATAKQLATDLQLLQRGMGVRAARAAWRVRRRTLLLSVAAVLAATAAVPVACDVGGVRERLFARRIRSIAVLPLANLSGDPRQEYFADGMTEELIGRLARIGSIRVISRTSVMAFKGSRRSISEIARTLGVEAVVEGGVLQVGDRVRVIADFVSVKPERSLWSDRFEGELRDVLGLQARIAEAIAGRVAAAVTPAERARLKRVREVDPAAHEEYLKGRYALNQFDTRAAQDALQHFQAAVQIDSTQAAYWSGVALACYMMSTMAIPPSEAMPRVRQAALRALRLDPALDEARTSLGLVLAQYEWNWRGAEAQYRQALQLNPNSSQTRFAYCMLLQINDRPDEAIREGEHARQLDPLSEVVASYCAWSYYCAARYPEALERYRALIARDSTSRSPHYGAGLALVEMGRYEEGIREIRRSIPGAENTYPLGSLAYACARAGRTEEARRLLWQLLQPAPGLRVSPVWTAFAYAALGEKDRAFECIAHAIENHDEDVAWLQVDPRFRDLRSDPRFAVMLRRLHLAA